ncbi:MAG: phosphate propanoyltransferase [Synergistaceae bacterium]|nr:phosphate propanoyltransferase [Synergistaceae bacterium]
MADCIVKKVIESLEGAGFVQVEVSARHVHLSQRDLEILFGKGATLTPKRPLSQPGQYLSEERVVIRGTKSSMKNIAILGPIRPATQVELSKSDAVALGVKAPVRESGDTKGSGAITIEGPCGTLELTEGAIVAKRHVHITPEVAAKNGYTNGQIARVQVYTDRPLIFDDVVLRVSPKFRYKMHVDFDEANAAGVSGFTLGRIITK